MRRGSTMPAKARKNTITGSSKPVPKASSMRVLKSNTSCMVHAASTKLLLKLAKNVKMTGNTTVCPNQPPHRNSEVETNTKGSATLLLVRVEPRRHEGPGLPEEDRQRDDEAGQQRALQ